MSDSPLATAAKSAQPKAKKAAHVEPAAVIVGEASQEHGKKNVPSLDQYLQKERELAPGGKADLNSSETIPEIGDPYDGPLMVDLGFKDLVEFNGGYVSMRPHLELTQKCANALKRLSLTLDQMNAKLADGTQVRDSFAKSIVWLCEKFAEAVQHTEKR